MLAANRGKVIRLKRKSILYFGGTPALFRRLAKERDRRRGSIRFASRADETSFDWIARHDVKGALSALQSQFVNLLVIDLRDTPRFDALVREARDLLKRLDHAEDLEQRYAFHRILLLVPDQGVSRDQVDSLLVEFGSLGVKHVLRQYADVPRPFESVAHAYAERIMTDRRDGKSAICGAGGGTTGIYYELGVLKCLDDQASLRLLEIERIEGQRSFHGAELTPRWHLDVGTFADEANLAVYQRVVAKRWLGVRKRRSQRCRNSEQNQNLSTSFHVTPLLS